MQSHRARRTRSSRKPQPRRGFQYFVRDNKTIWLALAAGLASVTAAIVFTAWLGKQLPLCPDWAKLCTVSSRVELIRNNYAIVQGLVTVVYAVGMAALAYTTHALSESAMWPLLSKRSMTLKQMDTYLEASRGSVPSSPLALLAARNIPSAIVLTCTIIITLTPFSGAPLIGYVYQRQNISVPFQSEYQPGGGIGSVFKQQNPPSSIRDRAATFYTSWASGLAIEPLQEYRGWFIDRTTLARRGNMSVIATRMKQNITCCPWQLGNINKENSGFLFETNMANKDDRHNSTVWVMRLPKLAVWAHDYNFPSPTRTVTTLVFAAVNGSIDGGLTRTGLPQKKSGNDFIATISALACDVDLELVEDHLKIGKVNEAVSPVPINTLADVKITQPEEGPQRVTWNPTEYPKNTLNELVLWFTVAPVTNGASIKGAQPMYGYSLGLPRRSTTTAVDEENTGWSTSYVENFIRVSVGASMLGDSNNFSNGKPRNFTSYFHISKLEPSRYGLLLLPPTLILISGAVLLLMNLYLHRKLDVPIMRLAKLSEILKSCQTEDLSRKAAVDTLFSTQPSQLGDTKVQFRASASGVWGLSTVQGDEYLLSGHELTGIKSSQNSAVSLDYQEFQH